MIIKRASTVLLPNCDNEFLTVSRRHSLTEFGLIGGKEDPGESTERSIVRETFEEANLKIDPADLMVVYVGWCPGGADGVAYWCTAYMLKRKLTGEEVSDMRAEEGMTLRFMDLAGVCDDNVSPFASFNRALVAHAGKVINSVLQQTQ